MIFMIAALLAVLFFRIFYKDSQRIVIKNSDGEVLLETSLNDNRIYEVEGKVGKFCLEVYDGRYRAINVECPNHDCEQVGWVSPTMYRPIICLPNGLIVELQQ